jgi:hypothetical protein
MKLEKRIDQLSESGKRLNEFINGNWNLSDSQIFNLEDLLHRAHVKNNWFEPEMVKNMLFEVIQMLNRDALREWVKEYDLKEDSPKNVGVIMAGNIPMVGFHDLLCVLISGNTARMKMSSKDEVLIPFWLEILNSIDSSWKERVIIENERMTEMDAVIATGSDNSARYFDYYFGKYPHIIRKNRTSVAVLTGDETDEELKALGKDMLMYFGLGCRNVSKLYLPTDFQLNRLFENVIEWEHLIDNQKYYNNYQYNRTVYLLNNEKFLDNNFLMVKEDEALISPVSVINYERYSSEKEVEKIIAQQNDNIQCVVGKKRIPFGTSQSPSLNDYADNVDVLEFLSSL